jgi:hypothetical protein
MKTKHFLVTILLTLAATGCASDGHTYVGGKCITCWNDPITKEPINHDGKDDLQQAKPETLGNQNSTSAQNKKEDDTSPKMFVVSFTAPMDVDVAYIKLKKEFNYYSEQEIRQEWGNMAGAKMQTFAYAYEATPTVYYRMRADRKHNGIFVIIDSQIEKLSNSSSKITISYWINKNSVNPTPYGESLTKRAKHALNI